MKNLAIFASGSGSNAENISEYFKNSDKAQVKLILTNKADAGVIARANKLNIKIIVFNKNDFYSTENVLASLKRFDIELVILAGFLWLIPQYLIKSYPNKIINIHPALLPKFGGKGMYGMYVHNAVIEKKENKSGITIHYVNEKYDEGNIIAQFTCKISAKETAESLASKIHELEYEYFPKVIDNLLDAESN